MTELACTGPGVAVAVPPPGPRSLANLDRLQRAVGRSNYAGLFGITLARGEGAYVVDLDGNRYLDCLAGASANVLGYGVGAVAQAYADVAAELQHSCLPYSPNTQVVELAEKLQAVTPLGDATRVLFGVSGSDATGGALSAMRKFTGRLGVLYFHGSYHGSTGLSQQASGFEGLKVGLYRQSHDFIGIDFPDTPGKAEVVLREIAAHLGTGRVGGLLAEPIQGDGGVRLPAPGFFERASKLLHEHGALLACDEVQSGMGRTGSFWAIEGEGVTPDLLCSAKGLSGGYAPISALVGREEVIDSLEPAQHIFTYSGHGPSSAAALACVDAIEKEHLVENAALRGAELLARLQDVADELPDQIVAVRGRGLMIGLQIQSAAAPYAAKVFATRGVEKGIYFGFFGVSNRVLRIEPPLTIGPDEVATIARVVREVAVEMRDGRIPSRTYENVLRYGIGL